MGGSDPPLRSARCKSAPRRSAQKAWHLPLYGPRARSKLVPLCAFPSLMRRCAAGGSFVVKRNGLFKLWLQLLEAMRATAKADTALEVQLQRVPPTALVGNSTTSTSWTLTPRRMLRHAAPHRSSSRRLRSASLKHEVGTAQSLQMPRPTLRGPHCRQGTDPMLLGDRIYKGQATRKGMSRSCRRVNLRLGMQEGRVCPRRARTSRSRTLSLERTWRGPELKMHRRLILRRRFSVVKPEAQVTPATVLYHCRYWN